MVPVLRALEYAPRGRGELNHLPVCQSDNSVWVVDIIPVTLIRSGPNSEGNKLPIAVRVVEVIDHYRPTQAVAVLRDWEGINQSRA
jgi:hypothetical protein